MWWFPISNGTTVTVCNECAKHGSFVERIDGDHFLAWHDKCCVCGETFTDI